MSRMPHTDRLDLGPDHTDFHEWKELFPPTLSEIQLNVDQYQLRSGLEPAPRSEVTSSLMEGPHGCRRSCLLHRSQSKHREEASVPLASKSQVILSDRQQAEPGHQSEQNTHGPGSPVKEPRWSSLILASTTPSDTWNPSLLLTTIDWTT